MLEKVEEYVAKGSIPFFWNQGENMLGNLSQAQLKAMTDQISKIRRLIIKYSTTDTSKIYDLFCEYKKYLIKNFKIQNHEK